MSIWKKKEEEVKVVKEVGGQKSAYVPKESVLDALNKHLDAVHGSVVEKEEVKVVKRDYRALLESGESFGAVLVSSEANGDYVFYDGEYKVILKNETMISYGLVDEGRDKITLLGDDNLKFRVVGMSDVPNDKGKYEVYIEISDRKGVGGYRASAREVVMRELRARLDKGEEPIVWGRITKVRDRDLMADLCDVGVLGELAVTNWQASFTRSLLGLVREGDYYQFQITGYVDGVGGKQPMFFLSRRKLAGDLWELANLGELEEGQQIIVTCQHIPDGKPYWWGVSDRLPGVMIMCDYTQKYVANVTIFPNVQYICRVKRIDKVDYRGDASYRVSVKPLRIVKGDVETVGRLRRLHGTKLVVKEDVEE